MPAQFNYLFYKLTVSIDSQDYVMGNTQNKNNKPESGSRNLNVAELNYSGILLSPFQFYSHQFAPIQELISKTFKKCMEEQFKGSFQSNSFTWNLGHIDVKFQKQRYSPLYNRNVGINAITGKLMGKKQFETAWNFQTAKIKDQLQTLKTTQKQIQNARIFDFLCYEAIVLYTYKINSIENIQAFDPTQYKNVMKLFFSKSYVNEDIKIQKFLKGIQKLKLDVIFLQETTTQLLAKLKKMPEFQIYQSKTQKKESLLVLRKNKFSKLHDVQGFINNQNNEVKQLLKWNSDMAIAVADNYIFISGHLSSKPQKNNGQVLHMNKCMKKLADMYPQNTIVIGCDVNTHYSQAPIPFHVHPSSKMQYTNVKKRTYMQAQYSKADKMIQSCVDFLISNTNLYNTIICDITGEIKNRMNITYIPKEDHPFDHFLVCGSLGNQGMSESSQKNIECNLYGN